MTAPTGYTQSPNGFTYTNRPNPDQGWLTASASLIPLVGSEKIEVDVPSHDGIQPGSGFAYSGSFLGGSMPYVTGRFYGTNGADVDATLTVTATLYATPVYIPNSVTVATLNLNVTTGQTGGAAHIGIYTDNAGYPGTLVYDSGAIAATSTAMTVQTLSTAGAAPAAGSAFNLSSQFGVTGSNGALLANNVLTPGWYWFASIFTASGTFPSVSAISAAYGTPANQALGSDTAAHLLAASADASTGISVAGTYGALPNTFTAAATLVINAATPTFAIGV